MIAPSSPDASTDAMVFQKIINAISKETIPAGYYRNFTPGLSPQIRHLTMQRDAIRAVDPTDPQVGQLNRDITALTREEATRAWRKKLDESTHKTNLNKFWNLIRSLSGKRTNLPPNQPITFGHKTCTRKQTIANKFNKQFTSITTHRSELETRKIIRRIHRNHKLDPNFSLFSPESVAAAMRSSNSALTK